MAEKFGSETIEGLSAQGAQQGQGQIQVSVDDSHAGVTYSSTARVWGSAEEINLDFAGPLRPTGNNTATLKIDQRVILNPWAAKRLAMLLQQTIQRYESTYGEIELDERKRRVGTPPSNPAPGSNKLS